VKPSALGDFCNFFAIFETVGQFFAIFARAIPAGGKEVSPPALVDFCKFLIKIMHFYAYFSQNNCLKQYSVTHQLKAFEKQSKPGVLKLFKPHPP